MKYPHLTAAERDFMTDYSARWTPAGNLPEQDHVRALALYAKNRAAADRALEASRPPERQAQQQQKRIG